MSSRRCFDPLLTGLFVIDVQLFIYHIRLVLVSCVLLPDTAHQSFVLMLST